MSATAATARIANAGELAARGMTELRELALRIASAGLAACDVGLATEEIVSAVDGSIEIDGRAYALADDARLIVVGSGKATLAIAGALERRLGDRIDGGAVVVRDGEDTIELKRIEVLVADHPLPSQRSIAGARRVFELAAEARDGDLVLASFTGGSSSLTSLPPGGVSGEDKRRVHELLLASGAPITEVNAVRKHVSSFKGGRLAARIAPATLVNLTASDVAGDVLDAITDPTVQDGSTVAEATAILRDRGLWDELPDSVRDHLAAPEAESPRLEREPQTVLLVTGRSACEAMTLEAENAGAVTRVVSTGLEGEARDLGRMLAGLAQAAADGRGDRSRRRVLVGCGGEATVSLASGAAFGDGGPNQEAAVAAALALGESAAVSACFLDTDGSDGGTEAAGAIVDGHTAARAKGAGIDLEAALAGHRSGEALAGLDDRILTGPTQTNVNDLFVIAVGTGGSA
jgi:hydroxypyruvate reductase/glycerate 2-kinase